MLFDVFALSPVIAVTIKYKFEIKLNNELLDILRIGSENRGTNWEEIKASLNPVLIKQKANPTIESIIFLYHESKTSTDLNSWEANELLSAIQNVKNRVADIPSDDVFNYHLDFLYP